MLTNEQRERILRMSADGMKQREIAQAVGTTQTTVSRTVRAAKAKEPVRQKTLTAEQQADLVELVADGYDLATLAPDYGCDVDTLAYYVRKHQRAEDRERDREDRIVCGDKFSGLLLDQGNGDFHGTWKNADGTFEHVNFHGCTRETAKERYERWREEKSGADETYRAVFERPEEPEGAHETRKVYVVLRADANYVLVEDEGAAYDLAEQVESLTGVEMAVREVEV